MRGAKFHGNTCSDSTTLIFSIGIMWVMRIMRIVSPFSRQIGISNAGPASALESINKRSANLIPVQHMVNWHQDHLEKGIIIWTQHGYV